MVAHAVAMLWDIDALEFALEYASLWPPLGMPLRATYMFTNMISSCGIQSQWIRQRVTCLARTVVLLERAPPGVYPTEY